MARKAFHFWITSDIGKSGRKCCVLTSVRVYLIQKWLTGKQGSSLPVLSPDRFSTAQVISCILQNVEETQNVSNKQCLRGQSLSVQGAKRMCASLTSPLPYALLVDGWVRPQHGKGVRIYFCHGFFMTQRCYQGFPGKWRGCVNFVLRKDRDCSFRNNWSFADLQNALFWLWGIFFEDAFWILRLGAVVVRGETNKPFWLVSPFLTRNIQGQEFSRLLKLWIRERGGWKTCSFTDSPGKCPSQVVGWESGLRCGGNSWFLHQQCVILSPVVVTANSAELALFLAAIAHRSSTWELRL